MTDWRTMDIGRIMDLLPHRFPFLLVDRVLEADAEAKTIITIKNVTINEPFFQGHFPGLPIMPGVLQLEAMAQTAGVLVNRFLGEEGGGVPFFMAIDKARFRSIVKPGDQMRIEIDIIKKRSRTVKVQGKVFVDGKVASEAELMCMMTEEKAEA